MNIHTLRIILDASIRMGVAIHDRRMAIALSNSFEANVERAKINYEWQIMLSANKMVNDMINEMQANCPHTEGTEKTFANGRWTVRTCNHCGLSKKLTKMSKLELKEMRHM